MKSPRVVLVSTLAATAVALVQAETHAVVLERSFANWVDSCWDPVFERRGDDLILWATCKNIDGGLPRASIGLNSCITNDGGVLRPKPNGGFGAKKISRIGQGIVITCFIC